MEGRNKSKQNVKHFPVGYTTLSEVWLSEGMWTHEGGRAFSTHSKAVNAITF